MGLAKYMEDNLERLYSSLEESRQQVSLIDKNSIEKDWDFLKNRLEKELKLVIQQYDEVLAIVTNPQFDDFTELFEENIKLDKKSQAAFKQIDVLNRCLGHANGTIYFMRQDITNLHSTLLNTEKKLSKSQKTINDLEQIIRNLKDEMAPVKNKLNNQIQTCNNLKSLNEKLNTELEFNNEKLAALELLIDSPQQSTEILSIKDDEINDLKTDLDSLNEWCELLEQEYNVTRPNNIIAPQTQDSKKSKISQPKTLSSFSNLSNENDQLKAQLACANQTIHDKEEIILENDSYINDLKVDISKINQQINRLNNENLALESKIESLQTPSDNIAHTQKTVGHRKITTKKYEPPKKSVAPFKERRSPPRAKVQPNTNTNLTTAVDDAKKQDSQQQYSDYLDRFKKRR